MGSGRGGGVYLGVDHEALEAGPRGGTTGIVGVGEARERVDAEVLDVLVRVWFLRVWIADFQRYGVADSEPCPLRNIGFAQGKGPRCASFSRGVEQEFVRRAIYSAFVARPVRVRDASHW